MHTTTLRKVGGSVMLAVPPALSAADVEREYEAAVSAALRSALGGLASPAASGRLRTGRPGGLPEGLPGGYLGRRLGLPGARPLPPATQSVTRRSPRRRSRPCRTRASWGRSSSSATIAC